MKKNVEIKIVDEEGNPLSAILFDFDKYQGIDVDVVDKNVVIDVLTDSSEFLSIDFPFVDGKSLGQILYFFEALMKRTEEEWTKNPLYRMKIKDGLKVA